MKNRLIDRVRRFRTRNQRLKVGSVVETLERIREHRLSAVRFGDGELSLMTGRGVGFQDSDATLCQVLRRLSMMRENGLMVCVPDVFDDLDLYRAESREFWRDSLERNRHLWLRLFDREQVHGNAFISRPYMAFEDRAQSERCFERFKSIWADRSVLVIEGRLTRFGVGNDLLAQARSIRRVLAPEKNAYQHYASILASIPATAEDTLMLVALGPTSKPLVYDLHQRGYQAIDIGHLDIEYEWFLRKARSKIAIPGKYVNEVDRHCGGFREVPAFLAPDSPYAREVTARVGAYE